MEQEQLSFGYDLIRNDLLKEILGQDHDALLYWVGKALARKHPANNAEELIAFFSSGELGTASVAERKKERKNI